MTSSSTVLIRRVLIIDDNADAAELLVLILVVLGHDACMATDAASGIELAKTFKPEVIFLDIGMPKMNGFDAAIELRKLSELKRTHIIALTGWNDAATKSRVFASGFDRHMTKPAHIQDIEQILQDA
jgi:CheY-like chemotaxis protein